MSHLPGSPGSAGELKRTRASGSMFAAVIGVLLGIPTYGIPPAIGLLGTFIYLMAMQDSRKRRPVVWLALLIGLIGIGAGLYVSKVWWGGWPPIGPWARHGGGR